MTTTINTAMMQSDNRPEQFSGYMHFFVLKQIINFVFMQLKNLPLSFNFNVYR